MVSDSEGRGGVDKDCLGEGSGPSVMTKNHRIEKGRHDETRKGRYTFQCLHLKKGQREDTIYVTSIRVGFVSEETPCLL